MGTLVDLLGRIDRALTSDPLDPGVFEECATDLLSEVYPGISPIPGGTDSGRDADIHTPGRSPAQRLLVTKARTYKGVRANMVTGLKSMAKHDVTAERIVLANPALLSQTQRENLAKAAREHDVEIEAVYDRRFFASRLRGDGEWRHRLLGLSPEPISISRSPADLAESPWVSVALTSREGVLGELKRAEADLVVTGEPGVGKTRLVAALDEIVFVDPYAGIGQIADDLRAEAPRLVALDDAGQHLDVLRGLVRLRRKERDLLDYRIIAVCWPDEDSQILDVLGTPAVVEVPLLERAAIDEIVTGMGVTSVIARHQIVEQAQGRPGWAIALAAMFTAQQTWASLFDGQVLLGEVQRFLRKAGAPAGAAELLAMIAAIGPVTLADLPAVAEQLGLDLAGVRGSLTRSAHAGLVDVARRYDGERTYRVRPQVLADVLVADRAFRAEVPPFTLPALADAWPEHAQELARVAISSTRLGAGEARSTARELMLRLVQTDKSGGALERDYAMLDAPAARETLGWIRERFAVFQASGRLEHGAFEDEIETCALIARSYQNPDAVRLLLDAALIYAGPANRSTDPLSRLEEATGHFHPELAATSERLRLLAGNELDAWIAARTTDPAAWRTYAQALKAVLTPYRRTTIASPADPNRFTLYEGLIGEDEIDALYQHVWPKIRARLEHAPATAVKAAIDNAAQWLRIGSGHDIPFSKQPHARSCVDAALRTATALMHELEPRAGRDAGLTALLLRTAELHTIDIDLALDVEHAAFFAPIDHTDIAASTQHLTEAIARTIDGWNPADPYHVAGRLAQIKASLSLAHVTWPDRIQIACEHLARDGERLADWIDAALEAGLFPSAYPFVDALIEQDGPPLPTATLDKALDVPLARPSVLIALLTKGGNAQAALAIERLTDDDGELLEVLAVPGRLPTQRLREILVTATPKTRGRFALALFTMTADATASPPGDIAAEWREAIAALELIPGAGEDRDDIGRLFKYLVAHEPAIAEGFARSALRHVVETHGARVHRPVTERLHLLPPEYKTAALADPDYRRIRPVLVGWLIGPDATWAAEMLNAGTLTPGDVLMARTGFGRDELTIPQLAQLLVAHGVDPAQIAEQAQFGVYRGNESAHFDSLVKEFAEYAASGDPHVARVGRSGVDLFTARRAQARASEQRERVYGQ
jgi:hypothetical protein